MTVISPVRTRCPADLVTAIRTATQQHCDWQRTAELVADELRLHLPGADITRLGSSVRRTYDLPVLAPAAR